MTHPNDHHFDVTPEHDRFFTYLLNEGKGNATLIARAGCGKTSTAAEASRLYAQAFPRATIGYTSFAKKNVDDAKPRMDPRVNCFTMHSAGLRALPGRPKVDGNRERELLRDVLEGDADVFHAVRAPVLALVSAAKSRGLVPRGFEGHKACLLEDVPGALNNLAADFDIDLDSCKDVADHDFLFDLARSVLCSSLRDTSKISFDDMLYLPVVLGLRLRTYGLLLIDEAQDLSPIQQAMVPMLMAKNGRVVVIGDDRQAIYAWRGADSAGMDTMTRDLDCETFQLSTTRRCPRTVVQLAQTYVPDYTAHPDAPDGEVLLKGGKVEKWFPKFRPDDMVLCRNNAPLVALAYGLMRERIPFSLLGRDIGKGLLALVQRLRPQTLPDLDKRLNEYESREAERLIALARDAAVETLRDKCETLRVFIEEADSLDGMRRAITDMFRTDDAGTGRLTLSSVHRAKGAEAPRVFILDRALMPSRYARTAETRLQEDNLQYVAFTRAMETLVFVKSE